MTAAGPAAGPTPARRRRADGPTTTVAIVLRRSDFRESSRIVTCLSREHGRLAGLAKGAHRPDSPFLGRIDFLNEVRATFSADRGGLRLLVRAELLRERRELREPRRFVAANHLAWLCDQASHDGRAEPAVFDLLQGGASLLERCPVACIPQIVLGLELRHLDALGALPDLERCADCGAPLGAAAYRHAETLGLVCRRHAGLPRLPVGADALALLRALHTTAGRRWAELPAGAGLRAAAALPAHWLLAGLEQRSGWRRLVFDEP